MTLIYEAKFDTPLQARNLIAALATTPLALIRRVRRWRRDTVQARKTAELPTLLKQDIGEIDHVPPPTPTFIQSEPFSYQDRLQQMWLR